MRANFGGKMMLGVGTLLGGWLSIAHAQTASLIADIRTAPQHLGRVCTSPLTTASRAAKCG